MKLGVREFDAMQMGWRKWSIEKVEPKTFGRHVLPRRCDQLWQSALYGFHPHRNAVLGRKALQLPLCAT